MLCLLLFFSFQTKETSSALSSESGEERINDKNEHSATIGEEEMSSEQTLEEPEDVRDEEDKEQSEEELVEDRSVGDSSDGIQEPAAENSNKSDDSPTSSETSPTVPADTPSNAEEGLLDSENNASESFETTSAVNEETGVPDGAASS